MSDEEAETIPKSEHLKRLASKSAKIDALTQELTTLRTGHSELEKRLKAMDPEKSERRIGRLMEERDTALADLSAFRVQTATKETMLTAGITDPDDRDLLMWKYNKIDEKGRADLADWISGAAKEDRQLAHMFGSAEETPAPKPKSNGGAKVPNKPPTATTGEAIKAMSLSDRNSPEGRKLVADWLDSQR